MRLPPWDWRGFAALVLALGAAVSVAALCIGAVLSRTVVSDLGAALISGSLGTLIGAVATYVGGSSSRAVRLLQPRQPAAHASTPDTSPSGLPGATQGQPGPSGADTPLDD